MGIPCIWVRLRRKIAFTELYRIVVFEVRVWTGRYPTSEELLRYENGVVAPCILEALERDPSLGTVGGGITGLRGKPTDPILFDEMALQEKELDYGEEGFIWL